MTVKLSVTDNMPVKHIILLVVDIKRINVDFVWIFLFQLLQDQNLNSKLPFSFFSFSLLSPACTSSFLLRGLFCGVVELATEFAAFSLFSFLEPEIYYRQYFK